MDPAQPSTMRALLRRHGLRPNKRLGQHFLCDGNILDRIAQEALAGDSLPVVEIGAGPGALTLRLAARSPSVTAVEVDQSLLPMLREVVAGVSQVRVVHADFLRLPTRTFLDECFGGAPGVVAGNVPYGITAPILERLFSCGDLLVRAALLIQTEVADRLGAAPGTREYGSLTLFAAYHGRFRRVLSVPKHLFYPPPDVGSTLVVFEPGSELARDILNPQIYFRLVRAAFSQRRKTLANSLAGAGFAPNAQLACAWLETCGIAPGRRGETLSPEEYGRLANYLADLGFPASAGDSRTET